MRVLAHSAVLVSLVGLLTVGGMVVTLSPASAVTGGAFDPSNFGLAGDPLVEAGAANATSSAVKTLFVDGQLVGMMMNKIRYAKGWTAITGRLGFGAKQIEADATAVKQIGQLERAYAPIATKLAPVVKVIGATSEIAMAAQMGITAGANIDRLAGVDVTGGLCSGTASDGFSIANSIIAFASSTNCETYKMGEELKAKLNTDAVSTVIGGVACSTSGVCVQLQGTQKFAFPSTEEATMSCWTPSGTVGTVSQDGRGFFSDGHGDLLYLFRTDPLGGVANAGLISKQDYSGRNNYAAACPGSPVVSYMGGTNVGPADGFGEPGWTSYAWGYNSPSGVVRDGSTGSTSQTSADPPRTLRCDVTMTDGSVATASTAVFHESDRTVPPPLCPGVPGGAVEDHGTIWETGGAGGDVKWQDLTMTPEYKTDATTHPDCQLGQCRLELIRIADGLKCLDAGATCDGWFQDPSKTTDYKCVLGPYDLPLDHCNVMEPTFNAQKVSQGAPYADPSTGTETGQTVPKPSESLSHGPDPQTGECFPTGWGVLNPLEWVAKPVGCALQWAFVPPPSTVTALETTVSEAWKSSTPGKLEEEISHELPEFKSTDSGCDGVLINFPQWSASGQYAISPQHVLAACPGDYFAKWAPLFSVFIGGSFTIVGILGAKRLLSALFGFHDPGMSV